MASHGWIDTRLGQTLAGDQSSVYGASLLSRPKALEEKSRRLKKRYADERLKAEGSSGFRYPLTLDLPSRAAEYGFGGITPKQKLARAA